MGHVTDVLLLLTDAGPDEQEVAEAVNQFFARLGWPHALSVVDTEAFGGGKAFTANVLAGAFNKLDAPAFVQFCRAEVDWAGLGCACAQLVLQDEHDDGFGVVEVWREQTGYATEPFHHP